MAGGSVLIHWMNLKNQMPDCEVVSRQSNGQTSRDLVSANMPVKHRDTNSRWLVVLTDLVASLWNKDGKDAGTFLYSSASFWKALTWQEVLYIFFSWWRFCSSLRHCLWPRRLALQSVGDQRHFQSTLSNKLQGLLYIPGLTLHTTHTQEFLKPAQSMLLEEYHGVEEHRWPGGDNPVLPFLFKKNSFLQRITDSFFTIVMQWNAGSSEGASSRQLEDPDGSPGIQVGPCRII